MLVRGVVRGVDFVDFVDFVVFVDLVDLVDFVVPLVPVPVLVLPSVSSGPLCTLQTAPRKELIRH